MYHGNAHDQVLDNGFGYTKDDWMREYTPNPREAMNPLNDYLTWKELSTLKTMVRAAHQVVLDRQPEGARYARHEETVDTRQLSHLTHLLAKLGAA